MLRSVGLETFTPDVECILANLPENFALSCRFPACQKFEFLIQEICRIGQNFLNILFIRMKCCSILYQSYVGNMKKFYVLENSTGSSLDQKWDFLRALFSKTWHFLIFPTHNQQRIGQHFMQMNKMCRKTCPISYRFPACKKFEFLPYVGNFIFDPVRMYCSEKTAAWTDDK